MTKPWYPKQGEVAYPSLKGKGAMSEAELSQFDHEYGKGVWGNPCPDRLRETITSLGNQAFLQDLLLRIKERHAGNQ